MSLVTIVITLIVVGVLLWLVNTYIPMDGKIKKVLNIVVMVVVVLWLLNVFGVWGHVQRRSGHNCRRRPWTCRPAVSSRSVERKSELLRPRPRGAGRGLREECHACRPGSGPARICQERTSRPRNARFHDQVGTSNGQRMPP